MEDYLRDTPEDTPTRTELDSLRLQASQESLDALGDLDFTMAHIQAGNFDQFALPNQQDAQNPSTDPFHQQFEFLSSPTQQPISPRAPALLGMDLLANDPLYADPGQPNINNLDRIISPDNNPADSNFMSLQYFSPNQQGSYNPLGLIAEDLSPNSYLNTFSPTISRHGSINIPLRNQQRQMDVLLSPNMLNAYDGSFRSSYGSYINLPPAITLSQTTSQPNAVNFNLASINSTLATLQPASSLGVSAPSSTSNLLRLKSAGASKQLTQEERMRQKRQAHNDVERRRRELIKIKIAELGHLVPVSLLTPTQCAIEHFQKQGHLAPQDIMDLVASVKPKDVKPNKTMALQLSVQYIRHLELVLSRQQARSDEVEQQIAELEGRLNDPLAGETPTDFLALAGQQPQQTDTSDFNFNLNDYISDPMAS